MKDLINGIFAGIMIGIGGCVALSLDNNIIGAIFFSIGLFVIVTREFNLFTGKIGYIVLNKINYLRTVILTLIGNFIGTNLVSFVLKFTRRGDLLFLNARSICNIKLSDDLLSIFILSALCGILMFIAVDGYKTMKDSIGKYAGIFLCVIVFILCGFEHSIANMFYFGMADLWNLNTFLYLFIMILGNSVGGILIPLCDKITKDSIKEK